MNQNFYLKRLLELKNNFSVKIISGVRGVGKSTLLKAFAENLRSKGVAEEEIIFIDCAADERLKNFQTLYEFVEARTLEAEKFFLLIDEADSVDEGEKAINALFVGTPAEIYVTASSETFVEKISVLLHDNCDVLKIYPLSFAEYAKNFSEEEALSNYLHFGGMPVTFGADKNILPGLLRGMTYEIMFELVEKNSLRQAGLFRLSMKTLAQNVGCSINLNQLIERLNCKLSTLKNYFNCGACLFQKIPRFDIKAEEFIKSNEKIYCIDNGLLCALAEVDEKILMENVVCVELLRRDFQVSSGKFGAMNINFVAERGDEKIFIQVLPPDNSISVRRITRPLRALPTDAEKILITLKPEKNFGNVKNITLHDFLLNV